MDIEMISPLNLNPEIHFTQSLQRHKGQGRKGKR